MDSGDRVALRRDAKWTGTIKGRVMGDIAHVAFDAGGTGNFALADLTRIADKSWPPADIEHKTPQIETK
jgi:hypothetical protein